MNDSEAFYSGDDKLILNCILILVKILCHILLSLQWDIQGLLEYIYISCG